MMKSNLIFVPCPKKIDYYDGNFVIKNGEYISFRENEKNELYTIAKTLQNIIKENVKKLLSIEINESSINKNGIYFEKTSDIKGEAYSLIIRPDAIRVIYGQESGAFYAVCTLKEIIKQCGNILPCIEIYDYPDFENRGIMIDISRDKIPTMSTLYRITDLMADLKLNQLQLYIEGMPFAYQSFKDVWIDGTPITGEEILELDKYCKERYIELVPNQNSFGHMAKWLARKEFNDMAECPNGFEAPWGHVMPATLNPLDKRSILFIKKMYDDILPYFSSGFFNVGCDETFELGMGKSKEACENGKGRVYLEFLLKIYDEVKKHGKKMMFWDDIIIQYPELVKELPKDVTALEWGYEWNQPFEEHCSKIKEAGIPFYVCPGTSSWVSISGKTENMKMNLLSAATSGKKYGAKGFLNTDWGDGGHWQYLPISYPSFVYGAALSWGVEENQSIDIARYLNEFVFYDKNCIMGDFILDLGKYGDLETEKRGTATNTFFILQQELQDMSLLKNCNIEDFYNIKKYCGKLSKELDKADMQCDDADVVYEEMVNAIRFIKHGSEVGILKFCINQNEDNEKIKQLKEKLLKDASVLMNNHKIIWLKRNRIDGLEDSVGHLWSMKM